MERKSSTVETLNWDGIWVSGGIKKKKGTTSGFSNNTSTKAGF